MRFRETWGSSWRDPRVPGTRHWRSHSVYFGWWDAFWLLAWWLFLVIIVAPLWLELELCFLLASLIWLLIAWLAHPDTRYRMTWRRWGIFGFWTV